MPSLSWSHPVPCHVFHSVPDPLHGHSHYPEGYSIGMRVVRPHTFPFPHCSSVVWRWVLGNSPAALHEKGAPIVPSLPPKSFVLSVLPVSVCHSLEFRAPQPVSPASLRASLIPEAARDWSQLVQGHGELYLPIYPSPSWAPSRPSHLPSFVLPLSLLLPPHPRFVSTSHRFSHLPSFFLLPGSYAVIYIFVLSLSSCGDNLEFLWDVSFKIFK